MNDAEMDDTLDLEDMSVILAEVRAEIELPRHDCPIWGVWIDLGGGG